MADFDGKRLGNLECSSYEECAEGRYEKSFQAYWEASMRVKWLAPLAGKLLIGDRVK